MQSYEQALAILTETGLEHSAKRLHRYESLPLNQTSNRIAANDVKTLEPVPAFNNSAMDGFALVARATQNASSQNPIKFRVNGLLAAGAVEKSEATSGCICAGGGFENQALEIMTGAALPEYGYDAVVKVEDVKVIKDNEQNTIAIEVTQPVAVGANIRLKATDFQVGQTLIKAGWQLQPQHLMAAASQGITEVNVLNPPQVAIIATGSELVSINQKNLAHGMIRNSTSIYLETALKQMGITPIVLGIVQDDIKQYLKAIKSAQEQGAEIIISTGAVSMGKYDFVVDALKELAADILFHKVAIRPGKPVLFAEINNHNKPAIAFFGVPGNPVSTAVALRFFIEPYLRSLLNLEPEKKITALLTKDCHKPPQLKCFYKGLFTMSNQGQLQVQALAGQASYQIYSMLEANCWVAFDANEKSTQPQQSLVQVYPLANSWDGLVL